MSGVGARVVLQVILAYQEWPITHLTVLSLNFFVNREYETWVFSVQAFTLKMRIEVEKFTVV